MPPWNHRAGSWVGFPHVAVVSLLSLLPPTGTPVAGGRRVLATVAGLAVIVFVPLGVGAGSAEMRDATSLGLNRPAPVRTA